MGTFRTMITTLLLAATLPGQDRAPITVHPVAPLPAVTPNGTQSTVDAKWQANMTTLAQKWATWLDANTVAFGVESEIWYYDGGRVYQQVANYTGDPKWNGYADKILVPYAQYIIANGGGAPGYRVFGRGLRMGYQRSHNPAYAQALHLMVYGPHSAATPNGGVELRYMRQHGSGTKAVVAGNPVSTQWSPIAIRESAYIAEAMMQDEAITGVRHPLLHTAIYDCIIPDLTAFETPGSSSYLGAGPSGKYINNFMIGLALESLIEYYQLTQDAGVLPTIKTTLDFFWNNCVEQSDPFDHTPSYAMYYNSDPTNGWDAKHTLMPDGVTHVRYTASSLNPLIAPAYQWYGATFNDASNADRGAKLYAAGVLGAGHNCAASKNSQDLTYTGKQYSQNYKWFVAAMGW